MEINIVSMFEDDPMETVKKSMDTDSTFINLRVIIPKCPVWFGRQLNLTKISEP